MKRLREFLRRNSRVACFLTLAWMLFIFLLSSIPYPEQPREIPRSYYTPVVEHVIEYSVLGILLVGSLSSRISKQRKILILAVLISLLYGISDEIHQYYVPGRYCSLVDIAANSLGSLLGGILGVGREAFYSVSDKPRSLAKSRAE